MTDDGQALNAGNVFVDAKTVYAVFAVQNMKNGTAWRSRWLFNGEEVLNQEQTWDGGNAKSTWVSITHPDGLPPGQFTLELYIGSKLAQSGDFEIAEGGTGIDQVKPINVTGVVHDADNARNTIAGALIVFLEPGVTIQNWIDANFDETMIYASGTSARRGVFQLDGKVTPGEAYSVVVVHDDYKSVEVEEYVIPSDASDPYELDVAMERN